MAPGCDSLVEKFTRTPDQLRQVMKIATRTENREQKAEWMFTAFTSQEWAAGICIAALLLMLMNFICLNTCIGCRAFSVSQPIYTSLYSLMAPLGKAKGPTISRQPLLYLVAPAGLEPATKRL